MNWFFPALGSIILAASCSVETEDVLQETEEVEFFAAESMPTKTHLDPADLADGRVTLNWDTNDEVGVFGKSTKNAKFLVKVRGTSASFSGRMNKNDIAKYAYYPFNSSAKSYTAVPVSIPTDQEWVDVNSICGHDVKASNSLSDGNGGTVFNFEFLTSFLKLHVDLTDLIDYGDIYEDEVVESIVLRDENGNEITGSYNLNLTDLSLTGVDTYDYIKIDYPMNPSVVGQFTSVTSLYPAIRRGDKIGVTIETNLHYIYFNFPSNLDFQKGYTYTFTLNVGNATVENNELDIWEKEFDMPKFSSFKFEPANNVDVLLAKDVYFNGQITTVKAAEEKVMTITPDGYVYGCIPYLYDFNLAPTFELEDQTGRYKVLDIYGDEQVSGVSVQDFSSPVDYVIYDTQTRASKTYTVNVFNSGLPVVVLNQSSVGSVQWLDMQVPAKDSEFTADDNISIYDWDGTPLLENAACGFRLRGNYSQGMPKKPFAIKLAESAPVLGMPAHKRWVLLANWNDKTLMRDHLAHNLAQRMIDSYTAEADKGMRWAPSGQWVELVLNGEHVGNYYLCEQIKIDSQRINIKKPYESVLAKYVEDPTLNEAPSYNNCGYLFELDSQFDEPYKFRTSRYNVPVNMKDPLDESAEGAAIFNTIQSDFTAIETAINDAVKKKNFAKVFEKVDLNAAADYFILQELAMNNEYKHPKSVYMFKDGGFDEANVAGGRYCFGPVWDFDVWTFSNLMNYRDYCTAERYLHEYDKFQYKTEPTNSNYVWFKLFAQNSTEFQNAVRTRWAHYSSTFPAAQIEAYIQDQADLLSTSAEFNQAMWPNNSPEWTAARYMNGDEGTGRDGSGRTLTYQETIDLLKNFIANRFSGMNSAMNNF